MVVKGERVVGGMDWKIGVSTCRLLYMEEISSKVLLLYGTENYVQNPMINHNGKQYEKKNVYIV